jgi:hypothetical protein
MLEEPTETIQDRRYMLREATKQNRIKMAVNNSASEEREKEFLAPVSLMVLGIGGRDNERKGIQTVSDHSAEQVKPPFDQTTGYPRHNFEQFKPSRRECP